VNEGRGAGCYDFFYLPIDFRNRCNMGYCFVNFLRVQDALRFYNTLHKVKLPAYNSQKGTQKLLR
jgi:hypothetical protein